MSVGNYIASLKGAEKVVNVEIKSLSQLDLLAQKYNRQVFKDERNNENCKIYFFVFDGAVYSYRDTKKAEENDQKQLKEKTRNSPIKLKEVKPKAKEEKKESK